MQEGKLSEGELKVAAKGKEKVIAEETQGKEKSKLLASSIAAAHRSSAHIE